MEETEKVCQCGSVVWSGALPHYLEEVKCRECGRDHSRRPPLRFRLYFGLNQLRRWRLYFGLRGMVVIWLLNPFMVPRERHKYQLPPYEEKKPRIRKASWPPPEHDAQQPAEPVYNPRPE